MNDSPALRRAASRPLQVSTQMSVGRAALLLSAMIALSRVAGFGRLVLTSYLYGISPITDAYNAAFNIFDTINILIAGGALATGFVPVFSGYIAREDHEGARRTFRAMFTLLTVAFGVLTLVLFALTFTKYGALLAPKKVSPAVITLYLEVLRILLVAQFLFIIGGLFTGVLNALRLFWYPALQPVIANLGIIIFGIALPKIFHMGIESQAWGALAGVLVGSVFIQLPAIRRSGLTIAPLWDLKDAGVKRVLTSLAPIVFGLSSGQIIALSLPRFFATALHPGDITALDNANRLMQVPLAVLASGPAIALYPTLSLLFAEGKTDAMREQLATAVRRTLVLMLLATALLMALRFPVIHLLLEHGKFDKADTNFTSGVLFFYAAGLIGLGAQQLLARGFFAMNDSRATVIIGVFSSLVFGVLAWLIVQGNYGASGLALAATIAITLLAVFMAAWLTRKLGGWDEGATLRVLVKAAIAAAICYFVTLHVQRWLGGALSTFDTQHARMIVKLAARSAVVMGGAAVGTISFALVAGVLGVEELGPLSRLAPKRRESGNSKHFRQARF
jgi:putative peptidoglycan lipid II flippase